MAVEFKYFGRDYNPAKAKDEMIFLGGAASLLILATTGFIPVIPTIGAIGLLLTARELGLGLKSWWAQFKARRSGAAKSGH